MHYAAVYQLSMSDWLNLKLQPVSNSTLGVFKAPFLLARAV